jgi:hypothetical protein
MMKDRYPRTVAEFAQHCMRVVVCCDDCDSRRVVSPDILSLTFGDDFDCYSSLVELRLQLRCEHCGQRRRRIELRDVNELEPLRHAAE